MSVADLTSNKTRLRITLGTILAALLVPSLVLVYQAWQQLDRDAFFQHRALAEELALRIDDNLADLMAQEDLQSFADYSFLVVAGDSFVQRSKLAEFPVSGRLPGLRSYFQIEADGTFNTPLLPATNEIAQQYGVGSEELAERAELQSQIRMLFSSPPDTDQDSFDDSQVQLDESPEEQRLDSQQVLDRLDDSKQKKLTDVLGSVEELNLDQTYGRRLAKGDDGGAMTVTVSPPGVAAQSDVTVAGEAAGEKAVAEWDVPVERQEETVSAPAPRSFQMAPASAGKRESGARDQPRAARVEQNIEPERQLGTIDDRVPAPITLKTFTSEVDPFKFGLLDDGHFVIHRNVWREQGRYVQGAVIDRDSFLTAVIGNALDASVLGSTSDLIVAYDDDVVRAYTAAGTDYITRSSELRGTQLFRTRLSAPFDALQLIFSVSVLPVAPGSAFIIWSAVALMAVLFGGFTLMYRSGLKQLSLSEQQQDFVSAVSHELKTPLTSIRMYGEILKAGWASEDKKREYYDFIFNESERLSRLINNVLQLARINRNHRELNLQPVSTVLLMDLVRSKVATQVEQAGFQLTEDFTAADTVIDADQDAFVQVMINLVDNAIKFSADATEKRIEISTKLTSTGKLELGVRDHGPGIPRDQMKKIFELFYRPEQELTRETVGTGIGLALVHQLVTAMHGEITVQNSEPGALFKLRFPVRVSPT